MVIKINSKHYLINKEPLMSYGHFRELETCLMSILRDVNSNIDGFFISHKYFMFEFVRYCVQKGARKFPRSWFANKNTTYRFPIIPINDFADNKSKWLDLRSMNIDGNGMRISISYEQHIFKLGYV